MENRMMRSTTSPSYNRAPAAAAGGRGVLLRLVASCGVVIASCVSLLALLPIAEAGAILQPVEKQINVAGTQQRLSVFLPSSASGGSTTARTLIPLVVQLNGFCENLVPTTPMQLDYKALINQDNFGWVQINAPKRTRRCQLCPLTNRIADSQGLFIYAGTSRLLQFTAGLGGCNAWNATTACCNDAVFAGGDVDFIRAAVAQALAAAPGVLDARRVFVVGIASGGFMALKVACAAPDLVRGVVAYAAASELNFAAMCPLGAGGYAPPVLMIHGTNDVVVPVDGDSNNTRPLERFPSADTSLANFARRNGCGKSYDGGSFRLDAPARATYDTPNSPYNYAGYYQVRTMAFPSCSNRVEGWRVEGANHFMEQGASKALFKKALEEFLLPLPGRSSRRRE